MKHAQMSSTSSSLSSKTIVSITGGGEGRVNVFVGSPIGGGPSACGVCERDAAKSASFTLSGCFRRGTTSGGCGGCNGWADGLKNDVIGLSPELEGSRSTFDSNFDNRIPN